MSEMDMDIWNVAILLLSQHGKKASLVASKRANSLIIQGDNTGYSIWMRIGEAIREWERVPTSPVLLH